MAIKPANQLLSKLFRIGADCAAVISVGNFPQRDSWITSRDQPGMTHGDVAIALPMNQKDGNLGCGDSVFGRDLFEVQLVLPSSVNKCKLDNRAQPRASEPWASVEELADAVVADLAEACEGRFSGDGAEASFRS